MTKLMIVMGVLSLATVTGCGKKGGGAAAEALSKMEGFSKSMCDCKDKACADKVNEDMAKWGQEMAKNATASKDDKPDPELAKKSADVMTKYTECMTKLMMAGMGGSGSAEPVKKEPAGSDAKKDEPKVDDAAVEPAKTCSATAWKEKSGLFCVDAPTFKAGKPEPYLDGDGVRIYFKQEAKDGKPELMFNVTWRVKSDDPNAESIAAAGSMESDFKNNKGESQGKFAGGKGRFVVFARKPEGKSHTLYTVVNGKKHAYSCEASSYDAPIAQELIDGCKSVIPTD